MPSLATTVVFRADRDGRERFLGTAPLKNMPKSGYGDRGKSKSGKGYARKHLSHQGKGALNLFQQHK
jgi:hypothetical protein